MKFSNYSRMILLAGTVALFGVATACSGNGKAGKANQNGGRASGEPENAAPQITKVSVATATLKEVPQDETYSSTVQPFSKNNIAPQTASRIQKLHVEVGDYVSAGQVVAEMDRVQLEQSRLSLVNDSTELARIRSLFEEGGVSKSDLEAMELGYNVKKTQYGNLLENTVLRSPISGVITARNYDRGDMYAMQAPIYVVQQISPVKLLVGVSENDYTRIKKGDLVDITADALPGKQFSGKVNRIYPVIDAATHTVSVEVLVNNYDRVLRPGMYARVTVHYASRTSIVIPDTGVVKQQGSGQRLVYVLNPDNTVSSRLVTTGRHSGYEYEIVSGLEEGEQVVVKGQASLKSGSQVEVVSQ